LGAPRGLITVRLADVTPERVRWLWSGYLPAAKLTMLDGLPDVGKSTIALDLVARVSTAREMPDGSPGLTEPGAVVLFTAEDGVADTVRPRLDAAGGDPALVHVVRATRTVDDELRIVERFPELPADLEQLAGVLADTAAALVVVDVLVAYLGDRVNSYRDQDVRRVLGPLAAIAEHSGAAMLLLRHPTKAGSTDAVLHGGGSIGIIGAARVGLLAGYDPDDSGDDNRRRRLLAVAKCNIAPKSPTLAYRLVAAGEHGCAAVVWEGPTRHRADELVIRDSIEERVDRRDAVTFLNELLTDNGGQLAAKDVWTAAGDAGFGRSAIDRAAKALPIRKTKRGRGKDAPWVWRLPLEHQLGFPDGVDAQDGPLQTRAPSASSASTGELGENGDGAPR
jgi:hypothetical protein